MNNFLITLFFNDISISEIEDISLSQYQKQIEQYIKENNFNQALKLSKQASVSYGTSAIHYYLNTFLKKVNYDQNNGELINQDCIYILAMIVFLNKIKFINNTDFSSYKEKIKLHLLPNEYRYSTSEAQKIYLSLLDIYHAI